MGPNALSEDERQAIVTLCDSPDYAYLPPSQIAPSLLDQRHDLASEATIYRVLRANIVAVIAAQGGTLHRRLMWL